MKRLVVAILCFFFTLTFLNKAFAQNTYFSDRTRISLLISSPGEELYTAFGHSAIRVTDTLRNLDWVFNYGVFDFNTPNFYAKFVRGKLLYQLAIQEFPSYWRSYTGSQQRVTEQVLLLTPAQKREFLRLLMENYQPENRYYLYDFFYDNCATRIRDIIEEIAEEKLIIPEAKGTNTTFRDLLHYYVGDRYWTSFGIDIILGLEADKKAGLREQMFLPEFLGKNLAEYQFRQNGAARFILSEEIVLMKEGPKKPLLSFFLRPVFVLSLISLLLVLLSLFFRKKKQALLIDRLLFILLGLCGLFLLFMWFGTDHIATERNLNILWLNPLYLLYAVYLNRPMHIVHRLAKWLLILCNLAILINFLWWPQFIHPAFLPVIGLVVFRLVAGSAYPDSGAP